MKQHVHHHKDTWGINVHHTQARSAIIEMHKHKRRCLWLSLTMMEKDRNTSVKALDSLTYATICVICIVKHTWLYGRSTPAHLSS